MNDGKFCKHVWYNVYNNLIIYSVLNIIQEIFTVRNGRDGRLFEIYEILREGNLKF